MSMRLLSTCVVVALIGGFFLLLPVPGAPGIDGGEEQPANSFVLRDVRVFDGIRFLERRDVVVQEGRITAVSPRAPGPAGVPEYDGSGHTLLPGLIDAHTHNFGTARRDALRFGVTTQIDMFTTAASLPAAQAQRVGLARVDEADMWSAGTLVTAPGGHGTQFGIPIPTLGPTDDVDAFIAARLAEGSDFIKLVLEGGAGWGNTLPTLATSTLAAAIGAAQQRGKMALVHVGTRDEALVALRAGANGLVHLFGDAEADDAFALLARERGVFVVPTLAVLESASGQANGVDADPRMAPWLAPAQADSLRGTFPVAAGRETVIATALASVLRLHRAGVPVLAGSDAPNPGTAHGASLHRELELLVRAGLTPAAALAAATSATAGKFGLDDRGRVARGLRADLVLVAGDPAQDITATRAIVAVWKNGYRITRARFDQAADTAPPLADPVLAPAAWTVTSDRMQGGDSDAVLTVREGVLRVDADVRAGAGWPWAGAIIMPGAEPMAPVDVSSWAVLALRVRAEPAATIQVLFFSGRGGQPIPAVVPVRAGTAWHDVEIALDDVRGLDRTHVRAVAVVAGPGPGKSSFELASMTLR